MVARKLAVAREGHNLDAVRRHFATGQNPVNARSVFLNGFESIEGPDAFVHALACGRPGVGDKLSSPMIGRRCGQAFGGLELANFRL